MVPRAVHHLFTGITSRIEQAQSNNTPIPQFTVTAQFLELYNEEIIDLFARENVSIYNSVYIVIVIVIV